MIIFAVQTNLEISKKPEWLDAYRAKYDDLRYEYHVTLKQPCIIEEKDIGFIRQKLDNYFRTVKPQVIPLVFDDAVFADSRVNESEACVMIKSQPNDSINKLDRDILSILSEYKNYVWEQSQDYEANFMPHITVARNLNPEKFIMAKDDFKGDFITEGKITKVILSLVRNYDKNDKTQGKHDDSIYTLC